MKRYGVLIVVLAFFAVNCFPLFAEPIRDTAGKSAGSGELVLLHTNDHHGTALSNNGRGGLAERAAYIRAVKAFAPQVLLVDSGDINTGSALSNMFAAEPDILAYNIMGYDAVVFGNHEFDGSQEKLEKQISQAKFPFVCSNIQKGDGTFLGGNQYLVKQYNGFSVGIFGITTLRTRIIASPDASLSFINEIDAAREAVDILRNREKVDVVIGLAHMGDVKESPDHITSHELAAAVPGIDIIVDGHSHSFMEHPARLGSTWVVSANEWGKYVGHGKLVIRNGSLVDFIWKPIEIGPDQEVTAMLEPYVKKAHESLKETVGKAADTFIFGKRLTRYQETAIGNLVTDANAWYFRTIYGQHIDFAFHNGGNIRAELPAGSITREQILTILPFDNYLYIVSLKGSEIIELFDFIASIPQGAGGFPQFSADVRYTLDAEGRAIRDLTIGGAPVDPDRTYRFCTNDYILGGGDGYTVMQKARDPFNTSLLLSFVVIEYIKSQSGPISPMTDGRLTVSGGVSP
jgi:5'-nucleotidase/UDP-sugar diphosphatase